MFNSIGPLEIGIVLVIVLLIFGPKRLPGLGKSLGTGMREFKDSITSKDGDDHESDATPAAPERATLARAEEPVRESETAAPTTPTAEPRS